MKNVAAAIASLALCGEALCADPISKSCDAASCTDAKQIAWIDRAKGQIKAKLRDPGSAQFTAVRFVGARAGLPPMVCGHVNAKNGFGGYMGAQRFVSAGSAETSLLEHQVSDFDVLWNRACL